MTLQSHGPRRARDPVEREIARLAPWFHNLHLPSGHETAPDHPLGDYPAFKWRQLAPHLPEDLSGWRALDIGCNAGFYTFELAARGAAVTAIDHDEHYLAQARWAAAQLGVDGRVLFGRAGVYELARTSERYDLVLFLGVLYHLRHPLLAIDIVAEKVERLLVLQTLTMAGGDALTPPPDLALEERDLLLEPGWPKLAFVEQQLASDPTNWWAPNEAAVEAMLRSAGLRVRAHAGHELYVAEPVAEPEWQRAARRAELDSATGRDS